MRRLNNKNIGLITLFFLIPLTIIFSLFHAASGDEGGYHYQAVMMARGFFPVLDFYTLHMVWAYLPYAALAKLISTSTETMRLYSAFSILTVVFLIWSIARKRYGDEAALYTLVALGFNTYWLWSNAEVLPSASTNLGLVGAFYYLTRREFCNWIDSFLIGLFVGLFINSRVVLMPLGILLFILMIASNQSSLDRLSIIKSMAAFMAGLLIISLPTLLILYSDPDAFWFNYLLGRLENTVATIQPSGGLEWVKWFVYNRIFSLVEFFFPAIRSWAGYPLSSHTVSNIFYLVIPIGVALYQRKILRYIWEDRTARIAIFILIGIYGSYFLADQMKGFYLHHFIPFLALLCAPVLEKLYQKPSKAKYKRLIFILIAIQFFWYLFVVAGEIWRRNESGQTRPMQVAQTACWLEANTTPDTVMMSFLGGVPAAANRWQPRGYEQGQGLIGFFWPGLSELRANRFHILTAAEFKKQLISKTIPFVIVDPQISSAIDAIPDLDEVLSENYRFVAKTTGSTYQIFVSKDLKNLTFPELTGIGTSCCSGSEFLRMLEIGDYQKFIKSIGQDLAISISNLNADISEAISRALGLSFNKRCSRLLGNKQ